MLFKCPYPDCEHIGTEITKAHCKSKHHTERESIFEKYGKPQKMEYKPGFGINKGAQKRNVWKRLNIFTYEFLWWALKTSLHVLDEDKNSSDDVCIYIRECNWYQCIHAFVIA